MFVGAENVSMKYFKCGMWIYPKPPMPDGSLNIKRSGIKAAFILKCHSISHNYSVSKVIKTAQHYQYPFIVKNYSWHINKWYLALKFFLIDVY